MQTKLAVIALFISIVATAVSVVAYSQVESRTTAAIQQAESRTAAAIQEREQEFVEWLRPQLKEVLEQFDVAAYPENPRTAEEALAPLFTLVTPLDMGAPIDSSGDE